MEGEHRHSLHQRFLQLAVPPYRFTVAKQRPLPYVIRYLNDTPLKGKVGVKNQYFNEANEVVTVEAVAAEYYRTTFGYTVKHEEGRSLRGALEGKVTRRESIRASSLGLHLPAAALRLPERLSEQTH